MNIKDLKVGDLLRLRPSTEQQTYIYDEGEQKYATVYSGDVFIISEIKLAGTPLRIAKYECTIKLLHMSGITCWEHWDFIERRLELVDQ